MVERKGRKAIDYHKGIILTLSPFHTPKTGKRCTYRYHLFKYLNILYIHPNLSNFSNYLSLTCRYSISCQVEDEGCPAPMCMMETVNNPPPSLYKPYLVHTPQYRVWFYSLIVSQTRGKARSTLMQFTIQVQLVLSCPRLLAGKRGTMQTTFFRPINRAFPPQFWAE